MSDLHPGDVYRETGKWTPPVVFLIAVVFVIGVAVTFAGWRVHWWFAAQDATRQYQVTQNGTSNQDTLRAQVTSQLGTVATITTQIAAAKGDQSEISALEDQRAAVATIACQDAAQISGVPLPAQQAQWVSINCSDGNVSPRSSLYMIGAP